MIVPSPPRTDAAGPFGTLPAPLRELTARETLARLDKLLPDTDDLPLALLLVHCFYELVERWERYRPETPLAVYRVAVCGLSTKHLLRESWQLLEDTNDRAAAVAATVLGLSWSLLVSLRLTGNAAVGHAVARVLRDVLATPPASVH